MTAGEARRLADSEGAAEEVERETRVHDVFDEKHVAPFEWGVDVLQESHAAVLSVGVRRELDHIQRVGDPKRPGEVGEKHDARLQRRYEDRIEPVVRLCDLGTQLAHACRDRLARKVDGADFAVLGRVRRRHYDARRSRYRCARRSMSRR